ncbi:DUF397 domain-containing protein [Nocardia transvalensis]|uniref:DUF397 domain-containing protein n=1 Tax=Nocardia transvalensis TaxID=37333 RepID=UPI0009FF1815|nr:DUF397 domain-containing protein [Nocardia transvalensis]
MGYRQCVEIAWLPNGDVAVRDSKNPGSGYLTFTPGEWDAFTGGVEGGKFEQLNA